MYQSPVLLLQALSRPFSVAGEHLIVASGHFTKELLGRHHGLYDVIERAEDEHDSRYVFGSRLSSIAA